MEGIDSLRQIKEGKKKEAEGELVASCMVDQCAEGRVHKGPIDSCLSLYGITENQVIIALSFRPFSTPLALAPFSLSSHRTLRELSFLGICDHMIAKQKSFYNTQTS